MDPTSSPHCAAPGNGPFHSSYSATGACQHKTRPSSASMVSLRTRGDACHAGGGHWSETSSALPQGSRSNVRVVLRVRKLLSNEREKRCLVSANPQEATVTLSSPSGDDEKTISFDSGDNSDDDDDGDYDNDDYDDDKYDDDDDDDDDHDHDALYPSQEDMYDSLGEEFLDHNFEGYNTSILALGQPGSGKSHTMLGTPDDPGIIPRTCQDLFQRIESADSPNVNHKIRVSCSEITGGCVRDLLAAQVGELASASASSRGSGSHLKICESPTDGPYVKDLSEIAVRDFDDLMECYSKGQASRTTTGSSSKSHFIFVITLRQIYHDIAVDETTERCARIRFVDLAGSDDLCQPTFPPDNNNNNEDNTAATYPDKSLSTLRRVVAVLADQPKHTNAKRAKPVPPYRDCPLTWFLKDSLGGNSKTAVVACIAPGDYEESLSTIRFASQVRRVQTKPSINQDRFSLAERDARLIDMAEAIRALQRSVNNNKNNDTNPGGLTKHDMERQNEKLEEYQKQVAKLQLVMEETWMISESKIRRLAMDNEALQENLQLVLDSVARTTKNKSSIVGDEENKGEEEDDLGHRCSAPIQECGNRDVEQGVENGHPSEYQTRERPGEQQEPIDKSPENSEEFKPSPEEEKEGQRCTQPRPTEAAQASAAGGARRASSSSSATSSSPSLSYSSSSSLVLPVTTTIGSSLRDVVLHRDHDDIRGFKPKTDSSHEMQMQMQMHMHMDMDMGLPTPPSFSETTSIASSASSSSSSSSSSRDSYSVASRNACNSSNGSKPSIDEQVMDMQSQMRVLLADLSFFKLKVADDHKRFGIDKRCANTAASCSTATIGDDDDDDDADGVSR